MDAYAQQRRNDRDGLAWLAKFGWLRTTELGPLLWPNNSTCRQQADRLARSWLKRRLVLARELPERAGRALVLATAGVRLLAEFGIAATSGKDIGEMTAWRIPLKWQPPWLPPATWRHDLLVAGVLVELHKRGFEVLPEAHIRQNAGWLIKVPDGLAVRGTQVIWLEVEAARKSGKAMRELAVALCAVADQSAASVLGHRPTLALVAYEDGAQDERGHTLNHRARVRSAVAAAAKTDVRLMWARCSLRGPAGVGEVKYEEELVPADCVTDVLTRMDWQPDPDEDGVLVGGYGGHRARVWEYDGDWCWQIDDELSPVADTQAAAQRECAAQIVALLT
jgi:hypothetical protein